LPLSWIELAPTVGAAPLVECAAAAAIVLAVGAVRGWTSAFVGTGLALAHLPELAPRLIVGLRLPLGMRWRRKAMMRSAGIIAPHHEVAASPTVSPRQGCGVAA
jgi:uncharacterized membrane protein